MHRTSRRVVVLLGVAALAAAGLTAIAGPSTAAATHTWAITPAPQPPGVEGSIIQRVSCTSTTFCMAADGTSMERWDGTSWTPEPAVQLPGEDGVEDVSCVSATWCVALDAVLTNQFSTFYQVWDGTAWSLMPVAPGAAPQLERSVSCSTPTFCVAVGDPVNGSPGSTMWDGTTWHTVALPPVGQQPAADLQQVSCTSVSFCFAIGIVQNADVAAYTWNGTTWTQVAPLLGGVHRDFNVSCVSPSDCEILEYVGGVGYQAKLWNGSSFVVQKMANEGSTSDFHDISCAAANSCIAVGNRATATTYVPLMEQYNGINWVAVTPAKPTAPASLQGVDCVTPTACVAVGYALDSAQEPYGLVESTFQRTGAIASHLAVKLTATALLPGQPLTLTATVTPQTGGGTVSFWSDDALLAGCAAVPLTKSGASSTATCATSTLGVGAHVENVVYTGFGNYLPSSAHTAFAVIDATPSGQLTVPGAVAFKAYRTVLSDPEVATKPTSWQLVSGSLPAGLSLASTGVVSGTPTGAAGAVVDVAAIFSKGTPRADTFSVEFTVAGLTVSTADDQYTEVGKPFHVQLAATGGKAPLAWSAAPGSIPTGIKLSAAGSLTGTFTTAGVYSVPVSVHDNRKPSPQIATTTLVITVLT